MYHDAEGVARSGGSAQQQRPGRAPNQTTPIYSLTTEQSHLGSRAVVSELQVEGTGRRRGLEADDVAVHSAASRARTCRPVGWSVGPNCPYGVRLVQCACIGIRGVVRIARVVETASAVVCENSLGPQIFLKSITDGYAEELGYGRSM